MSATSTYTATDGAGYEPMMGRWSRRLARVFLQFTGTADGELRSRARAAVRAAYLDGEPDGPRSYAALAWAVKGVAP